MFSFILLICLSISFASSENHAREANVNINLLINVNQSTSTTESTSEPPKGFHRTGFTPGNYRADDPAFVKDLYAANFGKSLPKNFDLRTIWNINCLWMREIFDQGDCESSWAIAAASTIQDRICLSLKKYKNYVASAAELMNCVPSSGHDACAAGETLEAFKYFTNSGIVTGVYSQEIGHSCKPYPISPTLSRKGPLPSSCAAKCSNPDYTGTYDGDNIFRGRNVRRFKRGQDIVQDIQWEIFLNGPVVAGFDVYPSFYDFWNDESVETVYRKYPEEGRNGSEGHAVKIVGWGTTDNGTDYWIFLNSWGSDGARQGEGRFLRGANECGIEDYVTCSDVVLNDV